MFVYSIKAHNLKLIFSLLASVAVIVGVVLFIPISSERDSALPVGKEISSSDFKNVSSNEDRIDFLKRYGWEVDPDAKEISEIVIPGEFDSVYDAYNEIQIKEGMNLEKYKGKPVLRYTYLINNYEYDGSVYANLLIYKNTVIGADISSAKKDGFQHGLSKDQ